MSKLWGLHHFESHPCHYADDWVCAFRFQDEAERCYRVLPQRLERFGLQVAPEKTRRLRFSRFHPSRKRRLASGALSSSGSKTPRHRAGEARHRPQEVAGSVSADQAMDSGAPPSTGTGVSAWPQSAATRALPVLRRTWQLACAAPLLRLGQSVCIQVAQSARWQAAQLHLGAVYPRSKAGCHCAAWYYGGRAPEGVCMRVAPCAQASTTEEPDAGRLHVRVCAGGIG